MEKTPPAETDFRQYDLVPGGVIALRPDYTVIFWNRCMAEWTGIPAGEIEGTLLTDRYPSLREPSVTARISQMFNGGPAVLFSPTFHPHLLPCPLPDGRLRVQKTSLLPIRSGNETCALVFVEDVTDLVNQVHAYREMKKVAERQLRELKTARDALFLANKKINLLNSITRHDILNQLLVLKGFLVLSGEIEKDEKLLGYIDREKAAAEAIGRQIEFTRFYQDIGVLSAAWQNVGNTIRNAAESLPLGEVILAIDLPGIEIFADPILEKVFYNLMENSLRHGGKLTSLRLSCERNADGMVLVYEDDGVGIPEGVKEMIFRREYFKNTGLGLFLSREILAITGLTIRETGTEGKGARFEISVPAGMFRAAPADPA
jgi:signal transduction histidine kinase